MTTGARSSGSRRGAGYAFVALPLAGWLLFFLLAPLAFVAIYSFLQRGPYGEIVWDPGWRNYVRAFDPLYLGIYAESFVLATLTTLVCLAVGFPMAYCMATARPAARHLLFVLLMVPFLTNFVVRVYAIRILLGVEGPLNALLLATGVRATPLILTDTPVAVAIGMISSYLPFMVLPLYVVLEKLDFSLLDAAHDLGAHGPQVLFRVLLPLAKAGLVSGSVLVFVPTLGEFMIPDLLGGARTMLLGNLITEQFLKARDWPFGSALAMLLVLVMAGSFALQHALTKEDRVG